MTVLWHVRGNSNALLRFRRIVIRRLVLSVTLLVFSTSAITLSAQTQCPDLSSYYSSGNSTDWQQISEQLAPLQAQCLNNAEYYALYGAAELNRGNAAEAAELLERSLLLNPDNGAAQIDYSQALFVQGQLFPALEINAQLLAREDLPSNLRPGIEERQQYWRSFTRDRDVSFDLLAGYDNNLNSAPDSNLITLTLSGESIPLELSSDFQATSGPYLNFRLGGRFRQLAPLHQQNWLFDVRGRFSEDTGSDLLQLDGRYAFIKPSRRHSWQVNGGVSHLLFGGNSLFTAANLNVLYQPPTTTTCRPYLGLALQNQLFSNQNRLNALEGKASAGLNCPLQIGNRSHQISGEISALRNNAANSSRPGKDRDGWQFNMAWRFPALHGEIISQLNYTELEDAAGYSPLLANGAKRWLRRSYGLIQYRRALRSNLTLLANLFHQDQDSNLELFTSVDTTFEIGISYAW